MKATPTEVANFFVYSRAVASLGAMETALFTAAVPCVTTFAAGSP